MSDEVVDFRCREDSYPSWIRMSNSEPADPKKHKKGGRPKGHKGSARTRAVIQLTLKGEYVEEYKSSVFAANNVLNATPEGIGCCCRGKLKTSAGYKWRYKNENDS